MNQFRLSAGLAILTLLSACASYDHKAIEYEQPEGRPESVTKEDVTIAVDAVDSEAEAIAAFDEPVTEKGFYPLKLLISNTSEGRILIQRSSVRLRDANKRMHSQVPAVVMAEAVEDDAMAYALLGFGIFSYASATEANEERLADYRGKQLNEAEIIDPRRQHGAFVYFQFPDGVDLAASHLLLTVEHVGQGRASEFEVPIGGVSDQ